MDIRRITENYAVSPQIEPAHMAAIAAAGFTTVINNRPDAEITPEIADGAMQEAASAAGLNYVFNPVINGGLSLEMVENQSNAIAGSGGPVLAYCRTGTRSSIVWALGQAGHQPTGDIITALQNAGYQVPGLDAQIASLAAANAPD